MNTAYRTIASFAALALASIAAMAAPAGSTDIYAPNGIASSFRGRAEPVALRLLSGRYNGSTDLWGANGFRASFGGGDSVARPVEACGSGSTDMYGARAFTASFGSAASSAVGELAQACQGPAPMAR